MVELELEVKGHVHNHNFNHVSRGGAVHADPYIVFFDSQATHMQFRSQADRLPSMRWLYPRPRRRM